MFWRFNAGQNPADVGTILELTPGVLYRLRIQNADRNARAFVAVSQTQPHPSATAVCIRPGEWSPTLPFFADTNAGPFGVWVWSDREECRLVLLQYWS